MSSRSAPALALPPVLALALPRALTLALALVLVPLAAAHGDAPEGDFDPLSLEWHAYLAADGTVSGSASPPGAVPVPGTPLPPATAPPALRFTFPAPVAFEPGGGFELTLAVRIDRPILAEGDAFELSVEPDGQPVRVRLPGGPVLAPGTVVQVAMTLQAPGALYEQGAELALVVLPVLSPLPEGSLAILVGGDAACEACSRVDVVDMRVPAPVDLRLQDVPHTEIVLGVDQFVPPEGHAVNSFVVAHGNVTPPAGAWSEAGTYVVLRGEEADADARSHAIVDEEARRAAAHLFRVNGVPARVHPGLGVIVRTTSLPLRVVCEANCPAGGFSWTYAPTSSGTAPDTPSVLVPPPRATTGIPVSEDEPPTKDAPLLWPLALMAAGFAAALRRR